MHCNETEPSKPADSQVDVENNLGIEDEHQQRITTIPEDLIHLKDCEEETGHFATLFCTPDASDIHPLSTPKDGGAEADQAGGDHQKQGNRNDGAETIHKIGGGSQHDGKFRPKGGHNERGDQVGERERHVEQGQRLERQVPKTAGDRRLSQVEGRKHKTEPNP